MAHLGEELKNYRMAESLNQQQMAEIVGIKYRTYQGIESTGEVKKAEVKERILGILNGAHKTAHKISRISDSKADYGHDFSARAIFNLSESNRLIAESNASLAKSNEMLSQKVESTAHAAEETALIAAANLFAVRDILMEHALRAGLYRSDTKFLEAYDRKVNDFVARKKGVGTGFGKDKANKKIT